MTTNADPASPIDTGAMRRFHAIAYGALSWPEGAVLAVPTILKGRGVRTNRIPVHDVDALVELCVRGVEAGADVYVNVAPQRPGLDISARGGKRDAVALPALFADVDTADGVHKASDETGGLPLPTREDALRLIQSLPLPISMLVHTGGGFHVWCCLDQPLDHLSDAGAETLRRWKAVVMRTFNDAGFHVDAGVLGDPARMLRVPGTINAKRPGDPRPVRLLCDEETPPETWDGVLAEWLAEAL